MPESKRRKPKEIGPTQAKVVTTKDQEPSPKWYVITMAGLMAIGVLLVLVRFMFDDTGQWLLLVGLAAITAGFVMTTNYK